MRLPVSCSLSSSVSEGLQNRQRDVRKSVRRVNLWGIHSRAIDS